MQDADMTAPTYICEIYGLLDLKFKLWSKDSSFQQCSRKFTADSKRAATPGEV